MICPDCGAEVREVDTRSGISFAERADGGPWLIAKRYTGDDGSKPPLALRARARDNARWAEAGTERYRRHKCSRRVEIKDSLTTLVRVYGGRKSVPSISVPMSRVEGDVEPGDVLTLFNPRGGEVRAEVKRVEFVVVPRWETFKQPREAIRGR